MKYLGVLALAALLLPVAAGAQDLVFSTTGGVSNSNKCPS